MRSLTMSGGGAELPTRSKHAGGVISRAKSGLQRLARRIALLVALTVGVAALNAESERLTVRVVPFV